MKKIKTILILVFTVLSITMNAQIKMPTNFTEIKIPKVGSEAYKTLSREMNFSTLEYKVKIINQKLEITKAENNSSSELIVKNGFLKGQDHGEWGGKLLFVPNNSSEKEIEIKKGNVKFIFEHNKKIYFIEGLAHLSFNEGALYEINQVDNQFFYTKILDFDNCPEAYTIFDNSIYIASYQNFYKIENLKSETILKNTFWQGMYPNSIAMYDQENIFLGIRGGLIKLNLKTKQLKLYQSIK